MEHFDTYSIHPAVLTIDTMSIYMEKINVEKPCLYEMVACVHIVIFSCLLSDIN